MKLLLSRGPGEARLKLTVQKTIYSVGSTPTLAKFGLLAASKPLVGWLETDFFSFTNSFLFGLLTGSKKL